MKRMLIAAALLAFSVPDVALGRPKADPKAHPGYGLP